MVANLVLLTVGLALSFFMAWNLGANDASTPCSVPVGARVISVKRALILFAIFAGIGAILQGYMNIKTISGGIVPRIDAYGAITIILAACLWSAFCTWKGLEISNTHTVIGGVIGYALVVYRSVEFGVIIRIVISWIISPICSIVVSYLLCKLMVRLFRNVLDNEKFLKTVSYALVASLCFSAYSFGANDVGNATAVFVSVTQETIGSQDFITMISLAAFGALGIAVGGLTWGHRVIETVAFQIVRLDILSGMVAEITTALVVYLFVTIPYFYLGYGLPISTSIVGVGAIIGATLARRRGMADKKVMWRLGATWIITLPATMAMSATLYLVLSQIIGLRII